MLLECNGCDIGGHEKVPVPIEPQKDKWSQLLIKVDTGNTNCYPSPCLSSSMRLGYNCLQLSTPEGRS